MGLLNNLKRKHEVYQEKNSNASYIDFLFHSIPGVWRILIARLYLRKCNYVGKLVSVNNKPIIINDGFIELQDEVRIWSSIVQTKLYTGKHGHIFRNKKIPIKGFFVPYYFTLMNLSVFFGLIRILKGRQSVVWEKAERA